MRAATITSGKQLQWAELEGLDAMQAVVGGLIQRLELRDGCGLYVNEEGKIHRLPFNSIATDLALLNRAIEPWDTIRGDVFVTGPGDGAGGDLGLEPARHRSYRQLRKIAGEAGGTWVMAIARDADCPECGWPETYAEGPEATGPSRIGCRKCGWAEEIRAEG